MSWLEDNILDPVSDFVSDPVGGLGDVIAGGIKVAIGINLFEAGIDWLTEQVTPDLPDQFTEDQRGLLVNRQGTDVPLPVVYGRKKIGGSTVFLSVDGDENQDLWVQLAIADSEIQEIELVHVDDLDEDAPIYNSGNLEINRNLGSSSQTVDADLDSTFSIIDTSHKLSGVPNVVCRFIYDQGVYSSLPRINCTIKGRKIYDPRTSTTAYSANAALVVRDYLTNTIYGKGLDASEIDEQSFIDGANHCDETILSSGAPTIARYEINGVVNTSRTVKQNLQSMLSSFRAYLPRIGGKYTLIIEKDESSVFSFNLDNILRRTVTFTGTKKEARLNRVRYKYTNEDRDWQPDFAVVEDAGYLSEDNDIVLDREIQDNYEIDRSRALYKAEISIKRSRQGLACGFVANRSSLNVAVGDVVDVTHPTPGWTNKLFRVLTTQILYTGDVAFSLYEHEPTVYDQTTPVGAPTPLDTNLPTPYIVAPPTTLLITSGNNILFTASDGTVISRMKVSWTPAADAFVTQYNVRFRKVTDLDWEFGPPAIGQTANQSIITGVEDGSTYNVEVQAVNSQGFTSDWVAASHQIVGKTDPPPPPQSFSVGVQSDGTREFIWQYPNQPADFAGFKIRYFLGTTSDWSAMTQFNEGLIRFGPYESNLLLAGSYTFAIKAVDTSGNESTAVFTEVDLIDPRLGDSITFEQPNVSGWPGTKTDCAVDPQSGFLCATSADTWADLTNWSAWTSWNPNPNTPITYEHTTIDIGAIVSFVPVVNATVEGDISSIEISHSDDNVTYTSWTAIDGSDIEARYVRIRITVAANGSFPWPKIKTMFINISGETIEEFINDLDISTLTGANRTGTGHVKIPLTKSFSAFKAVIIAVQNVGAGGWTHEIVSKADLVNGPEIKIYNPSNVLADATIDAFIRGV